jgi:hypothetical protein
MVVDAVTGNLEFRYSAASASLFRKEAVLACFLDLEIAGYGVRRWFSLHSSDSWGQSVAMGCDRAA